MCHPVIYIPTADVRVYSRSISFIVSTHTALCSKMEKSAIFYCVCVLGVLFLASECQFIIQGGRGISDIIVTDDSLCYKEPKSPYNFFSLI